MVKVRWVRRCRSSTSQIVPPLTSFPPRRPLANPGTLSQCAEWHHPARQCLWHAQVGQCGCHRLDELLLPKLRIENEEVMARMLQNLGGNIGEFLHSCLVLTHQVEQSAYLPRSLLSLPACLQRAQSSTGACVFCRARWNLSQSDALWPCWKQLLSRGKGLQRHRTSCRRAEKSGLLNSA